MSQPYAFYKTLIWDPKKQVESEQKEKIFQANNTQKRAGWLYEYIFIY